MIAGAGLAAASALLLFAAGEPLGVGPLAWVALGPLFVAVLRADRTRRAWALGLVFGLVYFGVELSWIFLFGWMAWTALVAYLALEAAVATLLAHRLRHAPLGPLVIAGAWTAVELVKERWPYGGYSWGSVGTTQGSVPGVRWLAGAIGVYGLSFLVVLASVSIAWFVAKRAVPWTSLASAAGVLFVFLAVDVAIGRPPAGDPLRVAVVQGSVPRPVVVGQRDAILANHIEVTSELGDADVDLIVWPEEAIGAGVSPGALERVQDLARDTSTPMLVGQTVVNREGFFNYVRHIDETGGLVATYQKRHPVPFGEYVPVEFFRRFVGTLNAEIPTDQVPGKRAVTFDVATSQRSGDVDGVKVATPICFESVFPRDFRDFLADDAELFVLQTNDASFERSYASDQHLAHTRMRALELRQWVFQAALSGTSAVVGPDGAISHKTELFTTDSFVADVRARRATSLYARIGDVFPAIFAALAALGLFVRRRIESEP